MTKSLRILKVSIHHVFVCQFKRGSKWTHPTSTLVLLLMASLIGLLTISAYSIKIIFICYIWRRPCLNLDQQVWASMIPLLVKETVSQPQWTGIDCDKLWVMTLFIPSKLTMWVHFSFRHSNWITILCI